MKILKSITATFLTLAISTMLINAQKSKPMVSGYLIKEEAKYERALVLGSNKEGYIFYKDDENAVVTKKAKTAAFLGIWLFEPKDVTEAKNLFEQREYKKAKDAFIALQERYKAFKYLDDNYFELSQYYEMECYRKLKDYGTLATKLELYGPDKLTRPGQVQQTKLYKMYDAVHKKDWKRLETMCRDNSEDTLTLGQRAQVAFCHGLAYEGLKRDNDALNAYATAMTLDFTRSHIIVREAALNSLRIFDADKEVKIAIRLWGKAEEKKDSKGYKRLTEANALARLYEKAGLGQGKRLPAEYKKFQEFTSDEMLKKLARKSGEEVPAPKPKKEVKGETKEKVKPEEKATKEKEKAKTK